MTATVAFENYDPYEAITISKKAASQEDIPNYGNLKPEETFSVRKLLNLMLVYSSNDAAFALAEKMGVEKFVEKMNQKAKEIGMENTIFYNPTGLKDGGLNVSTAKNLAKLVKYILNEKPEILKISTEKLIYDPPHSIFEIKLLENQKLIGGKTGFLPGSEIGKGNGGWGCMMLIFKNENGILFLNIILGAKSSQERVIQMQKLVDWINGKI
jgi:D-alanyl-D-alanine carboxypeptidase